MAMSLWLAWLIWSSRNPKKCRAWGSIFTKIGSGARSSICWAASSSPSAGTWAFLHRALLFMVLLTTTKTAFETKRSPIHLTYCSALAIKAREWRPNLACRLTPTKKSGGKQPIPKPARWATACNWPANTSLFFRRPDFLVKSLHRVWASLRNSSSKI